jgi:hypothetical protein
MVAALEGEASARLKTGADVLLWVKPGDLGRIVSFFQEKQVEEVIVLGKVRPATVFCQENFDPATWLMLEPLKQKSPTAVLREAFRFLEAAGLRVLDPFSMLQPFFCAEGVLTAVRPSPSVQEDIDYGLNVARQVADWEIGQTLIIKDRTVVAVEGMEGTDRAIRWGGQLAGPGFVAVKAGRTTQDMRIDVPAVGLDTVRTLIRAGAGALGLEASKVAFFQKQRSVQLADAHGLSIVAQKF